ncbi:hypothetical protein [Piscirickettsia salmonis]|uniref:hypothetical protein n=1 Tax=Piscirickettsia salmonis TaxID=1238 RepID=UPI0012BAE0B6|nr:hypothetical protein [Piscirickettsia salmonis]QGP57111.1 hypothetical protein PsalSR1_04600 [Piscirickettsia salmonis]QGP61907.1 hypothetical protein PsalBI1_04549 [Piscirickettsia salmonis]
MTNSSAAVHSIEYGQYNRKQRRALKAKVKPVKSRVWRGMVNFGVKKEGVSRGCEIEFECFGTELQMRESLADYIMNVVNTELHSGVVHWCDTEFFV